MNDNRTEKPPTLFSEIITDFWRFSQLTVALGCLYTLLMNVINKVYLLLSGPVKEITMHQITPGYPIWSPSIRIGLPDPIAEAAIVCIVLGVLTYTVLKKVCETEWVQERVNVKKCWKKIKWYNPFSWIKVLVCTFVEVLKWVAQLVCKMVEVVVTTLVVACIVTTLIIIFA